jgi:chromosome segregation ATPase
MSKVNENIENVQKAVEGLHQQWETRKHSINALLDSLRQSHLNFQSEIEQIESDIGKVNNEIKLLTENVNTEKSDINNLTDQKSQLVPQIEQLDKTKVELQEKIEQLTSQSQELSQTIASKETQKSELEAEYNEKKSALEDMERSINEKVEVNNKELTTVKTQYDQIVSENGIWDYLFDKLNTPEVEIMGIIAANRNISLDDLKSKATSASPVHVGRAISKLEADGKITQTPEGNWDLSSSVLNLLD